MLRSRLAALALLPLVSACSDPECTDTADCASRGPAIVCVEERCVQGPSPDAGAGDAGTGDSGVDASTPDAGSGDAGSPDAGEPPPEASLRITEINPDAPQDLIELVAVSGGTLSGISLQELTNSDFAFTFPQGYTVETGAVLVLHLGGACTDAPGDPASCGQAQPFSASAWDFSMAGTLSYSGKVFELLSSKGVPVDGVPFVRASGEMPASVVTAVQRLQADRVWDATPCIHDMTTGFAKDRYCRNIAVNWSDLNASSSVMRISGTAPLTTPGSQTQWSGPLPSRWGTY